MKFFSPPRWSVLTPPRWLVLSAFAAAPLHSQSTPPPTPPAYHGHFSELPLGAVQPRGWIKSWLERQATGLTGHPENLSYPYDTCLFAGKIPPPPVKHGETWWPYEQAGYLVDGIVRLNRLVENAGIARLSAANLAYLRENSGPGKFGESTWGWPNAVVGRALMAEHSATRDAALTRALGVYFTAPRPWRNRDGFIFEQALYLYGQTGDPALLAFARDACDRFFQTDPRSFSHAEKLRAAAPLKEHGVTAAEQLKLLPLLFSWTGDASLLALANTAYRKVEAESLMPDGGMVSSENLGPTAFNSLHETCDLTDWSWSIGYLFLAGGEAHWGDLVEQTTFNALPGAVTKDFRQLQYFSSANQILASNTACPRIAPTRMSYRAAHDTECCSGNINRAMPNYVARMWLRSTDGVAAALYGPSELRTTIDDQAVRIIEETDYPFRDTISFKISVAKPATFALAFRIPEWCATAALAVNGQSSSTAAPPGAFAKLQREFRDGDVVTLRLPMHVELKPWFGGRAVSVQRGPLVYSLRLDEQRVETREDPEPIKRVLKGNNIQGFPAVEFFPASEWRYGLDSTASAAPEKFRVIESPVPANPFIADTAPVRLELPLRALPHWDAAWQPFADPANPDLKAAPKNPASLPADAELRDAGPRKIATLVPYGSTHLRLTTLPLIPHPPAP